MSIISELTAVCLGIVCVLGYLAVRRRRRKPSASGPQEPPKGQKVPEGHVDTTGLSKAEVLAALFNASAPVGMGFLQTEDAPQVMGVEDAQHLIDGGNASTPDYGGIPRRGAEALSFDYVYGRPLKVDLTNEGSFSPWGYDRDNGGDGSAQKVVDQLRATGDVNPVDSQLANVATTKSNARDAMGMAGTSSRRDGNTFHLGADELGEPLESAAERELGRLE